MQSTENNSDRTLPDHEVVVADLVRTRDDLARSEERFREIADLLPGIICEIDTAMKVTYVNAMGLKTFGFTSEDFESGINANDIFYPEDRERIEKDIFNIFHGDYGNPVVYRLRTQNGDTLHALINSAPLLKNGAIAGIRTCIIDISGRVAAETRLRESEERFRTVFQQSPIGIAIFTSEGTPIERNAAFSAMFGPGPSGCGLFELFPLTDFETASLRKGNSINRQTEFSFDAREEKDAERWFDWHVTPLGVGERGASAYLVQVQDITQNRKKQEAALQQERDATAKAEALVAGLRHEILDKARFRSMISRSGAMQEIFAVLPEIASALAPVLIGGESGTGKELIARSIHELSPRSAKPFVAINCAALPDSLLESELFGYRSGAFTDAKKDKPGKFALAEGGTVFLDEIGDISAAMQAKLLRVLQEKTYDPLGATVPARADVRVVAATNRDLGDLVKKNAFREDLYYRINTIPIKLPPLRERRGDIPLLCDHFLERFNARYGKSIQGISQEAMEAIIAHDFPGNIRELENAVEHCFVFCKEATIEVRHLPETMRATKGATEQELLAGVTGFEALERLYINAVLKETDGNKQRAAQRLGVHKATLFRKLKKLGI